MLVNIFSSIPILLIAFVLVGNRKVFIEIFKEGDFNIKIQISIVLLLFIFFISIGIAHCILEACNPC